MKLQLKYYFAIIPIIILAIYFTYIIASSPYFFANTALDTEGNVVITAVDKDGEAYKLGIRENDLILKVNEVNAADYFTIKRFNKIEQVKTITFQKNDVTIQKSINLHYTFQELLYHLIFPNIIFLSCLALSFVIILKQENGKAAKLFLFFLLTLGLGYISAGASSRGDFIARIVASTSFMFTPIFLLNLLFSIFEDLNIKQNWKWLITVLYTISTGLISVVVIFDFFNLYETQIHKIQLSFFFIVTTCTIYLLIKTYRKKMHPEARAIVKVLFTGIPFAFSPFLLMHALPFLLFNTSLMDPEFVLMFLLILPITILYLLLQDQIIDIDFLLASLKENLIYAFIAGIIFYTYSLLNHHENALINAITVAIIFLVLFSLKNRLSLKPKSKFTQANPNFQQRLNRYFEKAEKISSSSKLLETISDEIKRVIPKIKSIGHFTLEKESQKINGNNVINPNFIKPYSDLLLNNHPSIGKITNLKDGFCILIHEKEDTLFYLFCSYKIDRTHLNPVERTWIETLANYSNVLLTNQYTIDNVIQQLSLLKEEDTYYSKWLSKLLFSFSEKERVRLAGDLHDSVLQELTIINSGLATVLKEPLPTETFKKIHQVKEQVLDCIFTTRETCNELVPPFLIEFGLIQATENLIKKVHLEADFHVQFNHQEFEDDYLSEEYVITLYRIIQELLTNAMKHSAANTVTLSLNNRIDEIKLSYADNGVGLDVTNFEVNYDNFSGLLGMKERIKSIEGKMSLEDNNGLQITICLPKE